MKSQTKGKQQIRSLKNDVNLFSRLYIGCQNRDGNLEEFFQYENQAFPPAISDDVSIRLGAKSDILACLEEFSQPKSDAPPTSCTVLDGAVITQFLKPSTSKTFNEYAQQVFLPYILSKIGQTSRLDLVWDRYISNSLKKTTRAKRGKGIRRRVVDCATIPGNWSTVHSLEMMIIKQSSSIFYLVFSMTLSSLKTKRLSSRMETTSSRNHRVLILQI